MVTEVASKMLHISYIFSWFNEREYTNALVAVQV